MINDDETNWMLYASITTTTGSLFSFSLNTELEKDKKEKEETPLRSSTASEVSLQVLQMVALWLEARPSGTFSLMPDRVNNLSALITHRNSSSSVNPKKKIYIYIWT